MKELVGRITALDPEASETLKVVSYFDTLIAKDVGRESLLRGAAAMAGAPVGYRDRARTTRIAPTGQPLAGPQTSLGQASWPTTAVTSDAVVWIEREGAPHANDAMVLERVSIALAITAARRARDSTGSVELALSEHATDEERGLALTRLHLDSKPRLRAVALLPDGPAPHGAPSATVFTSRGLARAAVIPEGAAPVVSGPMGIGTTVERHALPESWSAALIALRLTDEANQVVDADALGGLLILAEGADRQTSLHPDAIVLSGLDQSSLTLLDAIAGSDSIRSAAVRLGRHHSTVQERASALAGVLGYDPRTREGRIRYDIARILLKLSRPGL
ncbi:hypothetical protein ACO2Q7_05235 [Rathayibacter sp. KR2-224]|uniref:hypothetical protein n=1 Tax=Rathayibacter sp. KR2-224 TaxID=3400913 RepID=UPI003C02AB69